MCKISSAALGKGLLTSLLLVLALFSPLKAQNAPAPTIIVNQVILAENSILGQVDGDWILHATPFFKAAGAEVSIQNQSLHANWTNASLVLTVGQASCLFNNKTYPLSVPPALDQNDLVVKLYEISQIIGATITPQDSRLCVQCTLMSNRVLRTTPLPGPTPLNPTQSAMQSYLANFSTSGGQIPGLGATNYNPLDTSPYTTYQSAYPTSSAQLPPAPPPVLGTAPVGNPPLAAQSATAAPLPPEAAPTAPGAPASEGSLAPAYQTTPPGAAPGTTPPGTTTPGAALVPETAAAPGTVDGATAAPGMANPNLTTPGLSGYGTAAPGMMAPGMTAPGMGGPGSPLATMPVPRLDIYGMPNTMAGAYPTPGAGATAPQQTTPISVRYLTQPPPAQPADSPWAYARSEEANPTQGAAPELTSLDVQRQMNFMGVSYKIVTQVRNDGTQAIPSPLVVKVMVRNLRQDRGWYLLDSCIINTLEPGQCVEISKQADNKVFPILANLSLGFKVLLLEETQEGSKERAHLEREIRF